MNTLPPIETAIKDLADIRYELSLMQTIYDSAVILSIRQDVDKEFYTTVYLKTNTALSTGKRVEQAILKHYPSLV